MANSPGYIVARLVPESPVSGAAFGTYLDGLRLQAFDANTGAPLSDYAYSSPLNLFFDGIVFLAFVSAITSASTPVTEPYGSTLTFDSTDGIPIGFVVVSADGTTIPASSNLQVSTVTAGSPGDVQLSGSLPAYVPAGTVVYFIGSYPADDNPANAPVFSFSLLTNSPATTRDGQPQTAADPLLVLHFADVSGVTVGMAVTGSSVAPGTTVAETDPATNSVTVSQPLSGSFSSPSSVTFALNPPYLFFQLKPLSGSPPAKPTELTFGANGTDGVATGMTLSPIPGLIALGTTVTGVTSTTVTLSPPGLQGPLPAAGQDNVYVPAKFGNRSAH